MILMTYEVRCRSCRTLLGVSASLIGDVIHCDDICADFPGLGELDDRDAYITALVELAEVPRVRISEYFDLSRQRVSQIVDDRSTA